MRRIAITGTRAVDSTEAELTALFASYLRPFAGVDTHWFLGGAAGVDSLALTWLAETNAGQLTVAAPVTVQDQPEAARYAIAGASGRIDQVVELAHPDGVGEAAWAARNQWLVDHSDFVIGFPLTPTDDGSGTWQTLRYAGAQGKPRLIVALSQQTD